MGKDQEQNQQEKQHEKSKKNNTQQVHNSSQHVSEQPISEEKTPAETPSTPLEETTFSDQSNPEYIMYNEKEVKLKTLLQEYQILSKKQQKHDKFARKALKRYRQELELRPYQAELIQMQNYLQEMQKRMIIIFEGRDAAGKGGTIRRVTRYMNERHYRVVALGKPTVEEETQWFYQKYVTQFPRGGEIVLFDRSWYTRAMVERVFGFCTEQEYKNFMRGVGGFKKDLVRQGTILSKLYFSVVKEEQMRRFKRRQTDPLRQWKLSAVDLQAQDRWDEFTAVKYDMLKRTSTIIAPWLIIRSNDKHKARLNTMKVILNAVPYERLNPDLDFVPDPEIVISGARELEIMQSERLKNGKKPHQK
jgi:polyphosphate kinase 2